MRPIEVPPYQLQTLISTSDIPGHSTCLPTQQIRCAQALGSEIYVGFANGELIRFALQADDPNKLESYMVLSRQTVPNDKSIDDIVLLPSLQRALVLSDSQIHFYTLPSLVPVNIKPIRHITVLAVDQQHLQRPPPSNNGPVEPVHFCAIKRNAIGMYSIRGDRLLFMKEIPLPAGATLAKRSGFTLCVANKSEYQMIDLENASAFDVIPISQAMDPVPFIVNPFITVIDRSEFLMLSYTGASTMGLFITSNGDPVRGTLEWGQHPISLSFDYPYITALLPNGTIEAHSVENQTIAQVISAPSNADLDERKKLIASLHGYLVPSTERSSKMRMVPVSLLRGQPIVQ
ncbi:hypothetical protein BDZ89DRAFT_1237018 [Hymenopellis radicata]|nr:hypothetical protein BDZ89DRAFT_1237018 [Hymenopellis radicata]